MLYSVNNVRQLLTCIFLNVKMQLYNKARVTILLLLIMVFV